jgi:hypothetical protein
MRWYDALYDPASMPNPPKIDLFPKPQSPIVPDR